VVVETKLERLLLCPAEAAEILGVSRSKLYELVAARKLPSVRLDDGRLIRIPLSALKARSRRPAHEGHAVFKFRRNPIHCE
jgi:excisionase family DNA binding protein